MPGGELSPSKGDSHLQELSEASRSIHPRNPWQFLLQRSLVFLARYEAERALDLV